MFRIAIFMCFLGFSSPISAQNAAFDLYIEPLNIPQLGGLQAYAFGQLGGKWLILGGRLDGLHRRQPFATFDLAGHNTQILVVDPVAKKRWTAPLTSLPVPIQEQLSSTNMQFIQEGDYLYIAGGYGYSATAGDHITYDKLTAVKVSAVIDAVVQNSDFKAHFRQISNPSFAVTGGHLSKIYDKYYLTGGQKFMGRYNPMGPSHGPGFVQEYTDQVRRFRLQDDGLTLSVAFLPAFTDAEQLHRRDYNVAPQIFPNGQEGITAFSGVFQKTVDLPYLNCVNIDSGAYVVNNDFAQYYNHYHCAFIPLYSSEKNEMHTVFFGGIAQFYDNQGVLVQDNNVPFVRTIARVTRTADGVMTEYKLPLEMPDLLGASSEFIPAPGLPHYANEVIKLDELTSDTSLLGYIYGGIASTAPNIFWTNTGAESSASSQIYKVYLIKKQSGASHTLNAHSRSKWRMQVFPNPSRGMISLKFQATSADVYVLSVADVRGKTLLRETLHEVRPGENIISRKLPEVQNGSILLLKLESGQEQATVKVVIQD